MSRVPRVRAALLFTLSGLAFFAIAIAIGLSQLAASAAGFGLAGLFTAASLGLLAGAGGFATRRPIRTALGLDRSRLGGAWIVLFALGTVGLSQCIDLALRWGGLRDGSSLEAIDAILCGAEGLPLLLSVIGIGIAPGIGEELLFRGFILRVLARRFGTPAGVVLSAALFAAAHLDPAQGIGAGLLGVYLGIVVVVTGSTRPAIVCHVANNLAAVAGSVWGWGLLDPAPAGALILALAGLAGLAAAGRAATRRSFDRSRPPEEA